MPIFRYKCVRCSKVKENISKEPSNKELCECGEIMIRTFQANLKLEFKGKGFTPKFSKKGK